MATSDSTMDDQVKGGVGVAVDTTCEAVNDGLDSVEETVRISQDVREQLDDVRVVAIRRPQ